MENILSPRTFEVLNSELTRLIREKDWSQTPLGPREDWPASLRITVDALLMAPHGMVLLWGPDLIQIYNDGYAAVMGRKHPEGLGQPADECWPELYQFTRQFHARVKNGEHIELRNQRFVLERYGKPREAWFDIDYSPVISVDEDVRGVLVSVFERTDAVLAENKLISSERRLASAISASGAGIFEYAVPTGNEVFLSPRWKQITGWATLPVPAEDFGSWFNEQIHPDDRIKRAGSFEAFVTGTTPSHAAEFRLRHRSGKWIWLREFADAVETEPGGRVQRVSGMILDETESRTSREMVAYLAHHDPLTGLANRTKFLEALTTAIASCDREESKLGLVLFDLDRFKNVNDSLGHPVGDMLLAIVSSRLRSAIRETDTAARIGGDEFAIVLSGSPSAEDLHDLSRRIYEEVLGPAVIDGSRIDIRASFGLAVYPDHGRDIQELMQHADMALYKSKQGGGRSLCLFHEGLAEAAARRARIEFRSAAGDPEWRAAAALPAPVRPRHGTYQMRRGAGALATRQRGTCPAGRLHRDRGGQRTDPAARRVDPGRSVSSAGEMAC